MKLLKIAGIYMTLGVSIVCNAQTTKAKEVKSASETPFEYVVEQFADIKVLRYQIPGWENLSLKEQKLVYYLTQAGYSGRDIIYDQNYTQILVILVKPVFRTRAGRFSSKLAEFQSKSSIWNRNRS